MESDILTKNQCHRELSVPGLCDWRAYLHTVKCRSSCSHCSKTLAKEVPLFLQAETIHRRACEGHTGVIRCVSDRRIASDVREERDRLVHHVF